MAVTRLNMWILFFLALVSWLIALAGLSAVQQGCGTYGYNRLGAGSNSLPGPGPNRCPTTNYLTCNPQCASYPDGQLLCTFYSGAVSCSRFFNYQWWQVWLQLFVLIWLLLSLLFAKAVFSRASMLALLTITTMQMLDFTGTFGALINAAGISNAPGSGDTRINAAFAGGLLVSMFNFLLILALGYIDREDDPGQNWAINSGGSVAEHDQFATAAPPSSNEHEKNSSEKNSTEMTPVKEKGSDEDEADVAPATPGL